MATPWASVTDVTEITGTSVTEAQADQAAQIVELFSGRPASAYAKTNARTQHYMRLAVAYQAAWMLSQPDMFTRSDVDSVSQDGLAVRMEQSARLIAPLARRSLKRIRGGRFSTSDITSEFAPGSAGRIYPAALGVVAVYDSDDNPTFPDDPWRPV